MLSRILEGLCLNLAARDALLHDPLLLSSIACYGKLPRLAEWETFPALGVKSNADASFSLSGSFNAFTLGKKRKEERRSEIASVCP